MSNLFIQEKLLEEHRQDVQRKLHRHYLLAGTHAYRRYHWSMARHVVALLGKGLIALGSRLEHVEQPDQQVAYNR
jgi:hypothetical protein